jgi:cytochrome d ubiquinol oxidase subunit II
MGIDLPLIWAVIIIFGIMMYVVMDGFDLGIGILFPFIPGKVDRDVMMNTVAPVWDGNETWLVLGGAALFGAFPLAYSVVLSALYLPLMLMLIGLIFRGVAFEFRFKAKDHKRHLWDKAFIGGSLAATFFQGVALGAFIDGIPVVDRQFAGGSLDWLTPFTLFCGVALVVAYACSAAPG